MDTEKNHLLAKTLASRIELGDVDKSDAIDEMFRQIQKKQHIDGKSQPLFGHPHLHRVLKDLVKLDSTVKDSNLSYSKQIAGMLLKHIDTTLDSRAVWILVELLEHDNTSKFVKKQLKENLKQIKSILDSSGKDKNKGL